MLGVIMSLIHTTEKLYFVLIFHHNTNEQWYTRWWQQFSQCFVDFDKFLEERAKAGDKALPLPSTGEHKAPASAASSSRKKAERTEDNLFAL